MKETEEEESSSGSARQPGAKDESGREKPEEAAEELRDRLLRLAAEFDNYKKRSAKELDAQKVHGEAIVVGRLLPTLDEFELAIKAVDKNDEKFKGIGMIYANFIAALKALGLKEINADGVYDPHRHEVIMSADSKDAEGTIIEVVRKGYMLHDIMLRPASVIISKGDEAEPEDKNEKE